MTEPVRRSRASIRFTGLKSPDVEKVTLALAPYTKEEISEDAVEDNITLYISPELRVEHEDFYETIVDLTIPQALAIAAGIQALAEDLRRREPVEP
jgi:hypothetical protein